MRPEVDGESRVRSRFYLDVFYAVREPDLQRVPGREPVNLAREPRYRFVGPGPFRRSADRRNFSKDGGRPVPVGEIASEDRGGELVQHLRECLVVTEGAQLADHHPVCGRLAVGVRHYPLYYFRAAVMVGEENEEEGVVVGPLVEGFLGRPVGPEPCRDYPGVPSGFVPCHRVSRPVRRTFGEPAPEREAAVELGVLDRVEDLVGNLPVRGGDAAVIRAWRPVPVLNLKVLQARRRQGTQIAQQEIGEAPLREVQIDRNRVPCGRCKSLLEDKLRVGGLGHRADVPGPLGAHGETPRGVIEDGEMLSGDAVLKTLIEPVVAVVGLRPRGRPL